MYIFSYFISITSSSSICTDRVEEDYDHDLPGHFGSYPGVDHRRIFWTWLKIKAMKSPHTHSETDSQQFDNEQKKKKFPFLSFLKIPCYY
jgi:hypothetical protein